MNPTKKRPDLGLLAKTAGSGRIVEDRPEKPQSQPGRRGTAPITLHFPKEVRNQLKMLAIKQETTVINLAAEAFNMLFAKYGMPEIAPTEIIDKRAE